MGGQVPSSQYNVLMVIGLLTYQKNVSHNQKCHHQIAIPVIVIYQYIVLWTYFFHKMGVGLYVTVDTL